jgi:hypothetical protein
MTRLPYAIGESRAADKIQEEPWWVIVMKESNSISKDSVIELQNETGQPHHKPYHDLTYEEAPFTRLLTLNIVISAWLGWVMSEKGGHPYSLQKIEESYNYGRQLSL